MNGRAAAVFAKSSEWHDTAVWTEVAPWLRLKAPRAFRGRRFISPRGGCTLKREMKPAAGSPLTTWGITALAGPHRAAPRVLAGRQHASGGPRVRPGSGCRGQPPAL